MCASANSSASPKRCSGCSCFRSCWRRAWASRFRNRPADVLKIAAVSPEIDEVAAAGETRWTCRRLPEAAAEDALRTGKVALLAEPGRERRGGVSIRRHESGRPRRAHAGGSRRSTSRGPHRPGGFKRPADARAGVALHRFSDSRAAGDEPDGQRDLGHGVRDRGCAAQEADEASDRDAHAAARIICCRLFFRGCCCWWWKWERWWGSACWCSTCRCAARWLDLAALCVLGSLSFSALGLLIASRVQTIEAASGLMNLVMMPMWIVSGVFFSAQRFPDAAAAGDQGAAADGADRRAAREHAARRGVRADRSAVGNPECVADGVLCTGVVVVPVALEISVKLQNGLSRNRFLVGALICCS